MNDAVSSITLRSVETESRTPARVIVANLCHLFDAPACERLLRRLGGALRPGGTLAVIDLIPERVSEPDRTAAVYQLGLRLRSASGDVHPLPDYLR